MFKKNEKMKESRLFGIIGAGNSASLRKSICQKTKIRTKSPIKNPPPNRARVLAEKTDRLLKQLWALTAMYDGALLGIVALLVFCVYLRLK